MSFKIKNGIQIDAGQSISEISTDDAFTDNSDTAIPTESTVKSYVDAKFGNISIKTSDYTLVNGDTNKVFSNYGASADIALTLPTYSAGLSFTFIRESASYTIRIKPNTGEGIWGLTSAINTVIKADENYASLTLISTSNGWYCLKRNGTWSTTKT